MWTRGTDALEGELQSSSEVDFYIDQVNEASLKIEFCLNVVPVIVSPVYTTPEEFKYAALFPG